MYVGRGALTPPQFASAAAPGLPHKLLHHPQLLREDAVGDRALLHGGNGGPADRYMSLKDFSSYAEAQQRVSEAYRDQEKWNRMALMNIANSGRFAADRSIAEYAQNIWRVKTNFAF